MYQSYAYKDKIGKIENAVIFKFENATKLTWQNNLAKVYCNNQYNTSIKITPENWVGETYFGPYYR